MSGSAETPVCLCFMRVFKCSLAHEVEEGRSCSSNSMDEERERFLARVLMRSNFDGKCMVSEDPISLT